MTEGPDGDVFNADEELVGTFGGAGTLWGDKPRWGFGRKAAVATGIAVALGAGGYGIALAADSQGATQNGAASGVPAAQVESGNGTGPGPVCGGAFMHGVAGTLKSDNGSTLTVQTPGNTTRTVTTTSSTQVVRIAAGSLTDVANGDQVAVAGSFANDTLTASTIAVGTDLTENPDNPPSGSSLWASRGFTLGTVADRTATGFTVVASNGSRVSVTAPSSAKVSTAVKIAISALKVGQPVAASGTVDSNGNISATRVEENDVTGTAAGPGFGFGFGFGPGRGFGPFGGRAGTAPSGAPSNAPAPPEGMAPHGGGGFGFGGRGWAHGPGSCSSTSPAPGPSASASGAA
jgi:hypothetical protein